MCVWGSIGVVRTLLVDLLVGQLLLLAQEVADHGGEEVAARAARVTRGMLGGTGEVIVIIVKGDLASSRRDCGWVKVVLVGAAPLG